MSTINEAYESGDVGAWRAGLAAAVKEAPGAVAPRFALAEALVVLGDYEKADAHFEIIAMADSSVSGVRARVARGLLRAAAARQDWFDRGRLPAFLSPPRDEERLYLKAVVANREDQAEGAALLKDAEERRARPTGECDKTRFTDFRDLDDRIGPFFETLSPDARYLLVPFSMIATITFEAQKRYQDICWRACKVVMRDGAEMAIFAPTIYPRRADQSDDHSLGRRTDWVAEGDALAGVGQKAFWLGGEEAAAHDLRTIRFDVDGGAS